MEETCIGLHHKAVILFNLNLGIISSVEFFLWEACLLVLWERITGLLFFDFAGASKIFSEMLGSFLQSFTAILMSFFKKR